MGLTYFQGPTMYENKSVLKNLDVRRGELDQAEQRTAGEIRAVNDEGVFEGYIAVWGSTDAYNSRFAKGAFKKTLQERGDKIKVFYNHEQLVGRSLEIREDDYGVFVRGKINLEVPAGQEAFAFMKDGTLDGLSFGFRAIKQRYVEGVREITEVKLYEYGPVVFPANDDAAITDVRNDSGPTEYRIRQNARRPDYDGTEQSSWGNVPKTFQNFRDGFYENTDAEKPDDPPTDVDQAPAAMKRWIASKSLLGSAGAEEWGDLLFFPVVNPSTNKLNRGALTAVLSGRGAQADISADQLDSARNMARNLLRDEFDVEVEGRSNEDIVMNVDQDEPTNPEQGASGEGNPEQRATDFNQTHTERNLRIQGNLLFMSLEETLWDIWWDGAPDEILGMLDQAISDFAANYLEWAQQVLGQEGSRSDIIPSRNGLAQAMFEHCQAQGQSLEDVARDTSLTYQEARSLQRGEPIESGSHYKLTDLPEAVQKAHQEVRGQRVKDLFAELRAGLGTAERRRIKALVTNPSEDADANEDGDAVPEQRSETDPDPLSFLRGFRQQLKGENNGE